jgi:hypothetical protein
MITNYQARKMLRGAAFSAVLLLMAVPAALADPQTDRLAQEQHACGTILGLNSSVAGYDDCIRSLDRSLSAAPGGKEAAACAYLGLVSTEPCAAELRATRWNEENIGAR